MDKDKFENYLINKIASMDISGDETLILSKDFISKSEKEKSDKDTSSNNPTLDIEILIKKINLQLKKAGKSGNISVSERPGSFRGGFILERNGVQINNTFEALVNSMRDELEYEIAKILFE